MQFCFYLIYLWTKPGLLMYGAISTPKYISSQLRNSVTDVVKGNIAAGLRIIGQKLLNELM